MENIENKETIEGVKFDPEKHCSDGENYEKAVITVKMTDKGRNTFIDMLQEHVGFIEEDLYEQIINDTTIWMNENYKDLLDFYIRAVEDGLVPRQHFMEVVAENNRLAKDLKDTMKIKTTDDEPKLDFQPLASMNGWDLRKTAKKLGVVIVKGMTKEQIYKLVKEKIKK